MAIFNSFLYVYQRVEPGDGPIFALLRLISFMATNALGSWATAGELARSKG